MGHLPAFSVGHLNVIFNIVLVLPSLICGFQLMSGTYKGPRAFPSLGMPFCSFSRLSSVKLLSYPALKYQNKISVIQSQKIMPASNGEITKTEITMMEREGISPLSPLLLLDSCSFTKVSLSVPLCAGMKPEESVTPRQSPFPPCEGDHKELKHTLAHSKHSYLSETGTQHSPACAAPEVLFYPECCQSCRSPESFLQSVLSCEITTGSLGSFSAAPSVSPSASPCLTLNLSLALSFW